MFLFADLFTLYDFVEMCLCLSAAQLCLSTVGTVTAGHRRWVSALSSSHHFLCKDSPPSAVLFFLLVANTANQLATLHSLCLTADVRSVPDRKDTWISNEASRHLVDVVDKRYLSVGNIWKWV